MTIRDEVISNFHFLILPPFVDAFSLLFSDRVNASAKLFSVSRYEVGYFFPAKANGTSKRISEPNIEQ